MTKVLQVIREGVKNTVDIFLPRVVTQVLWLSGTSNGPVARATPRISPPASHDTRKGVSFGYSVNTDSTSLISE